MAARTDLSMSRGSGRRRNGERRKTRDENANVSLMRERRCNVAIVLSFSFGVIARTVDDGPFAMDAFSTSRTVKRVTDI